MLEQAQVVGTPFACGNRQKLPRLKVNHQLSFERVAFMLALATSGKKPSPRFCRAIVSTLFFLGRSITTSVTSTTTTSQLKLPLAEESKLTQLDQQRFDLVNRAASGRFRDTKL